MNTESDFDAVCQNVLPELLAVPADQLIHLNAEVDLAVTTVAVAIAHTRALVDSSGPLPGVEGDLLDRLDRYRIALLVAHRRYHAAVNAPCDQLPELKKAAHTLRKGWLVDLNAMRKRQMIDMTPLAGVTLSNAYDQIAWDLQLIAAVLRQNWQRIDHRCALTPEDLDAGEDLAIQILRACSRRRRHLKELARLADIQDRAFTLLASSYDRLRRALEIARWSDRDAASIAPSFYAARRTTARPRRLSKVGADGASAVANLG